MGTGIKSLGNAPGVRARGTPPFALTNMSGLDLVAEVRWLLEYGVDLRIGDGVGRLAIKYTLHLKQVCKILRESGTYLTHWKLGKRDQQLSTKSQHVFSMSVADLKGHYIVSSIACKLQ